MTEGRSRMCWLAVLCFLPPPLAVLLFALEELMLGRGLLNTEDFTVAAGRTGTLYQELLNVWTWDAVIGLLCALSLLTVPMGILLLVAVTLSTPQAAVINRTSFS